MKLVFIILSLLFLGNFADTKIDPNKESNSTELVANNFDSEADSLAVLPPGCFDWENGGPICGMECGCCWYWAGGHCYWSGSPTDYINCVNC